MTHQYYDRKQITEEMDPDEKCYRPEDCRECGADCGRLEQDICLQEMDP